MFLLCSYKAWKLTLEPLSLYLSLWLVFWTHGANFEIYHKPINVMISQYCNTCIISLNNLILILFNPCQYQLLKSFRVFCNDITSYKQQTMHDSLLLPPHGEKILKNVNTIMTYRHSQDITSWKLIIHVHKKTISWKICQEN